MTVTAVLAIIALILAIVALLRPEWPLTTIAVILLSIGLIVPAFVH